MLSLIREASEIWTTSPAAVICMISIYHNDVLQLLHGELVVGMVVMLN